MATRVKNEPRFFPFSKEKHFQSLLSSWVSEKHDKVVKLRHKVAEIWKRVERKFPFWGFFFYLFCIIFHREAKISTASFITLNPQGLTKISREVWNFFPVEKNAEFHTILGNWRLLLDAQLSAKIIQAMNKMLPNANGTILKPAKEQETRKKNKSLKGNFAIFLDIFLRLSSANSWNGAKYRQLFILSQNKQPNSLNTAFICKQQKVKAAHESKINLDIRDFCRIYVYDI